MLDQAKLDKTMLGDTLKNIREKKGIPAEKIAEGIMSPGQLSRVERGQQVPGADRFIKLLYRLNVSFDEFYQLSDDKYIRARVDTENELPKLLREKDSDKLNSAIKAITSHYRKYHDSYFHHTICLLKAALFSTQSNPSSQKESKSLLTTLKPITNYLSDTKTWFEYEIDLFDKCIPLYPLETTIEIGDKSLSKIKRNYAILKNNEKTRAMLVNLATHALSNGDHYFQVHDYAVTALSLPQSTHLLYTSLLAKIIYQITCYKLENGEYDKTHLTNLIKGFKLMRFNKLYEQCVDLITKHEIVLDDL